MPKTVRSSRTSKTKSTTSKVVSKKPVKKTVKRVKKQASAVKSTDMSKSWWAEYCRERDVFYQTHPYARFLIGLLIISMAIAFGMAIYDWKEVYVGMQLDKEGIEYPYIKPVGIK